MREQFVSLKFYLVALVRRRQAALSRFLAHHFWSQFLLSQFTLWLEYFLAKGYLSALSLVYIHVYPLRWLCWLGFLPYSVFWFLLPLGTLLLQRNPPLVDRAFDRIQRALDRLLFAQQGRWVGFWFWVLGVVERCNFVLALWFSFLLILRLLLFLGWLVGFPLVLLGTFWAAVLLPGMLLIVFFRTLAHQFRAMLALEASALINVQGCFRAIPHWDWVPHVFIINQSGEPVFWSPAVGDGIFRRARVSERYLLHCRIQEIDPFFFLPGLVQHPFQAEFRVSLGTFLFLRAVGRYYRLAVYTWPALAVERRRLLNPRPSRFDSSM